MKKTTLFIAIFLTSTLSYSQKFENLAQTPPMGWNSWNKFACNIDEKTVREIADVMVESGLRDAGYTYINIDDCWHGKRDSLGFITADPQKFPSGIKVLSDYVHSKGLKLGIYSDAGTQTCGGRPGSLGHEYQDALTYAKWGIDYLKYDWCNTADINAKGAYRLMRDAIFATGRPIVFSMCEWGDNQPWMWAKEIGHLWRTTGDIYNCFDCVEDHGTWKSFGVLQILDKQQGLRKYAGPGHWNDPDMLEVGNGMSENQDRAHFSMWCMLAAPLILGNDVRSMNDATKNILLNKEVIAINQDSLGVQGLKVEAKDGIEVWFKPLVKDSWAICILNRNKVDKEYTLKWSNFNFTDEEVSKLSTDFSSKVYNIRNLWTKKPEGNTKKDKKLIIPAQDVIFYKISLLNR